ncbi:hypothetical protein FOA52_002796 [Chlamydomonas sp. UWO 241]|nr:hypothetical protein FOA52_002796 [Chlamydomonas sp. UWO 241]
MRAVGVRGPHVGGPGCPCCYDLRAKLLAFHYSTRGVNARPTDARLLSPPRQRIAGQRLLGSTLIKVPPSRATEQPVDDAPVPVRLPDDVLFQLRKAADERGESLDQVVTDIARSWIIERRTPTMSVSQDMFMAAAAAAAGSSRGGPSDSMDTIYVLEPIITLVDGLLQGDHTVAEALTHGDTGIGTLDMLDGEVVVYKGVAYHQTSDGSCHVLKGDEKTPYMTVTYFQANRSLTLTLDVDMDYAGLQRHLGKHVFRSSNVFYCLEVQGTFPVIKARCVPKQTSARRLAQVAADQVLLDFEEQTGVLVGFYSPQFLGSSISVPGFHLHYLSDDRKRGGHLLNTVIKAGATVTVAEIHRVKVDLPYRNDFMSADFSSDAEVSKDLELAENQRE